MSSYGFIITRHVNSEKTNRYWNQCVKLIRTYYPLRQIVVIDDNSNQDFVTADFNYRKVTYINSEYPGRGELLPYIYYLKHKWFPNAVIIHDSLFIHKKISFEKYNISVLPLWHHTYDKENLDNLLRIASVLTNNKVVINKLHGNNINILGMNPNSILCFGGQCYIKLWFLELLENKYKISNLVNVINNRTDRCGLERILGILFSLENHNLSKISSIFGEIHRSARNFNYTYDDYNNDLRHNKIINPFVKVWTGR